MQKTRKINRERGCAGFCQADESTNEEKRQKRTRWEIIDKEIERWAYKKREKREGQ